MGSSKESWNKNHGNVDAGSPEFVTALKIMMASIIEDYCFQTARLRAASLGRRVIGEDFDAMIADPAYYPHEVCDIALISKEMMLSIVDQLQVSVKTLEAALGPCCSLLDARGIEYDEDDIRSVVEAVRCL